MFTDNPKACFSIEQLWWHHIADICIIRYVSLTVRGGMVKAATIAAVSMNQEWMSEVNGQWQRA